MTETFASKVRRDDGELVYFVTGRSEGVWAWYYLRVDKLKQALFTRAIVGGDLDLADFGEVLASGYGKEPPAETRARFEAEKR